MNDIDKQRAEVERGEKARRIIESDIWREAWVTYEARLMQEFRLCKSDDLSRLQQLKQLHLAGVAAKSHMERVMEDGIFAAKNLDFQEKRGILKIFKK